MPITFDYLVMPYKYVFESQIQFENHRQIIFANDYKTFIKELVKYQCYDEYSNQDAPVKEVNEQYNIFDYLGG